MGVGTGGPGEDFCTEVTTKLPGPRSSLRELEVMAVTCWSMATSLLPGPRRASAYQEAPGVRELPSLRRGPSSKPPPSRRALGRREAGTLRSRPEPGACGIAPGCHAPVQLKSRGLWRRHGALRQGRVVIKDGLWELECTIIPTGLFPDYPHPTPQGRETVCLVGIPSFRAKISLSTHWLRLFLNSSGLKFWGCLFYCLLI